MILLKSKELRDGNRERRNTRYRTIIRLPGLPRNECIVNFANHRASRIVLSFVTLLFSRPLCSLSLSRSSSTTSPIPFFSSHSSIPQSVPRHRLANKIDRMINERNTLTRHCINHGFVRKLPFALSLNLS